MLLDEKVPTFQRDRFKRRFDALSQIGQTTTGAIHRPFGSDADLEARAWICRVAEEAGLTVTVDPVANIWGRLSGKRTGPAIVLGSHHDSVPDGGRFDGALGVLMAIEVIQSLCEHGYQNHLPLAFVSFTAEEPNPFDLSTLGSQSVAGRLTASTLTAARDWDGRPLASAIQAAGGNLDRLDSVRKTADDIAAFIELHIEQGRRLEQSGIPLGIVSGICGIYRETITVTGEANHAGTTRLADRRDALLAASEMLLQMERRLQIWDNPELIATVGRLAVAPNAVNIIPGECQFSLDIRAGDMAGAIAFRDACMQRFEEIARRRRITFTRTVLLDQPAQPMSLTVMRALRDSAARLRIPYLNLTSMAGHDATHMATLTDAGMLFVPSVGGKSHCKDEETRLEHIEQAFYVMASATTGLDWQLSAGRGSQA